MPLRYDTIIAIDLPREKIAALFNDPANLPKWQRGLKSLEHLSGEPGQPGARSKLVFEMGKRRMEMTETIALNDLPDAFDATYEIEGVRNMVENRFSELGPDRTLWESHNVFQFNSLPMKVMGWLMPGMFRRQSMKYAEDFKAFAERGVDVRTSKTA